MMGRAIAIAACALSIDYTASPAVDPPERYGLHETTAHRRLVEQAIVLTDAMLGPEVRMRLRAIWPPSGWFPTLYFDDARASRFQASFVVDRGFDNGIRYTGADIIPVYMIDGDELADVDTAFVPMASGACS